MMTRALMCLCAACTMACGQASPIEPRAADTPIQRFTVTGRVTAAGQPVGGAEVTGWHEAGYFREQIFAEGRTAADGSFRMVNVPAGRIHLYPAKWPLQNPCMSSATVSGDAVIELELEMLPALRPSHMEPLTLRGTVSDSAGQPIPGASVVAFLGLDDFADLSTRTDSEGQYVLCGLFPDFVGSAVLWITVPGYKSAHHDLGREQPMSIGDQLFVLDTQLGLGTR